MVQNVARAVVIGLLGLRVAAAGQSIDEFIASAVEDVKAGRIAEAAETLGRAAASAHKRNDLPGEEQVVEAIEKLLANLPKLPAPTGGRAPAAGPVTPDRGLILTRVLMPLEAKRNAAYLSARSLAARLLLIATATDDLDNVHEMSRILSLAAAAPKSGACARLLARYGEALVARAAEKPKDAVLHLEAAFQGFVVNGWTDLAIHAGTELAAVLLSLNDSDGARDALLRAGTLFRPASDPALAQAWRKLVAARLPSAPEDVLAPFTSALASFASGSTSSASGGAGGPGQSADSPRSKVGRAWSRMASSTPLATVRRTPTGFEIRHGFDPAFKAVHEFGNGVTHHADGGVTLDFQGFAVALHMVDHEGRRGQPGHGFQASIARAWSHLAPGETWSVTRDGLVAITGP